MLIRKIARLHCHLRPCHAFGADWMGTVAKVCCASLPELAVVPFCATNSSPFACPLRSAGLCVPVLQVGDVILNAVTGFSLAISAKLCVLKTVTSALSWLGIGDICWEALKIALFPVRGQMTMSTSFNFAVVAVTLQVGLFCACCIQCTVQMAGTREGP